ncbi:hypothetical protein C2I18_05815 [Paenibacillus sp. PK3_47]|nr:hypothetical protein C2I18_05815 [Paenibacillus sp. PK3_47]
MFTASQGEDNSARVGDTVAVGDSSGSEADAHNTGDSHSPKAGAATEELDLQGIKQLVHGFSMRSMKAESASISSTELIVTEDSSSSTAYELPGNEFFVSIAPYVNQTHPCAIHSLTGCQGEMVEEEFYVTVEDDKGNPVVERQAMKSQPNGFIDLWLPRDEAYQVTVEHEGKRAETEISTFQEDNTCITTMQLS